MSSQYDDLFQSKPTPVSVTPPKSAPAQTGSQYDDLFRPAPTTTPPPGRTSTLAPLATQAHPHPNVLQQIESTIANAPGIKQAGDVIRSTLQQPEPVRVFTEHGIEPWAAPLLEHGFTLDAQGALVDPQGQPVTTDKLQFILTAAIPAGATPGAKVGQAAVERIAPKIASREGGLIREAVPVRQAVERGIGQITGIPVKPAIPVAQSTAETARVAKQGLSVLPQVGIRKEGPTYSNLSSTELMTQREKLAEQLALKRFGRPMSALNTGQMKLLQKERQLQNLDSQIRTVRLSKTAGHQVPPPLQPETIAPPGSALHPAPKLSATPISVGETSAQQETRAAARRSAGQSTGIVSPGSQAFMELTARAQQEANELYGAAHRTLQPARAPGVIGRPFTQLRDQALGERAVYAVKSHNFWENTVSPALSNFASQARKSGSILDKTPALLRRAISLYIDRLGDPVAFDKAVNDAIVKYPDLRPVVERMNAMTMEEKAFAEQVINTADQARGRYLVDREIMDQVREFHVSHMWEKTPEGRATGAMGGGKLSPRTRYAQGRAFPTFTEGIAAGLTPKTLDIVAINQIRDLDTARAVMAKSIRDSLLASGEGKWITSATDMPEGWVDLGSTLRTFRHPISIKGADGTIRAVEQRLVVSPEANATIKFLHERDPFVTGGEGGQGLSDKVLRYNTFVKQLELSYSFFHDFNLAKVFIFSRPSLAARFAMQAPGVYQKWGPVAEGIKGLNGMTPIMEKLIRNGLVVGRDNVWDAYYNLVGGPQRWGLDNALVRTRNKALWGTLHPALKGADAMATAKDALRKFSGFLNPKTGAPWTEDEIIGSVAEVMNRKYGGLAWDRYGTTHGTRRILRALLLAPDWTISNVMLGVSALKGGIHLNRLLTTAGSSTVEGWAARQSLAKTAVSFMVALQGVNFLMSGHTTFQNPEGRWYSLQLPWKTKDGRNLYADWALPGELRDLIRIGAATGGAAIGIAANRQMPPQESIQGLISFGAGKASPIARTALDLASQTRWGGQPLFRPGMTEREKMAAIGGQVLPSILPIPIGLTAIGQALGGQVDPIQAASTLGGLGAVSRGTLVAASLWESLPGSNKIEFFNTLSSDERDDFLNQLSEGRITGGAGEKFRRYLDRYGFKSQGQRQALPPEERYLPPGVHWRRESISVTGETKP